MNTPSEGFALRFPYHQQFWHILKNDCIQKAHLCKQNEKCAYANENQIGAEHHNSWVLTYNNVHGVIDWLWEQSK